MTAKIVAVISEAAPWGVAPEASDLKRISSHLKAERAILAGDWPFVCIYCGDKFGSDRGQFPYCSPICAINAENS